MDWLSGGTYDIVCIKRPKPHKKKQVKSLHDGSRRNIHTDIGTVIQESFNTKDSKRKVLAALASGANNPGNSLLIQALTRKAAQQRLSSVSSSLSRSTRQTARHPRATDLDTVFGPGTTTSANTSSSSTHANQQSCVATSTLPTGMATSTNQLNTRIWSLAS